MFFASGSERAALEELLLGGDDGVHRSGRPDRSAFSSASIAVDALLSASLG